MNAALRSSGLIGGARFSSVRWSGFAHCTRPREHRATPPLDDKAGHLVIAQLGVAAFCRQARDAICNLMHDARAVLYSLFVFRETETPACELLGAICEVEDAAQGLMIRSEVEVSNVEVRPDRQDTPDYGQALLLGRHVVALGIG